MSGLHRSFHQACFKSFMYYLDNPNKSTTSNEVLSNQDSKVRHVTFQESRKVVNNNWKQQPPAKSLQTPRVSQLIAGPDMPDFLGLTVLMKCVLYEGVRDVSQYAKALFRQQLDLNKLEPHTRLNAFQLAVLLRRHDMAHLILQADHLGLDLLAQDLFGNTVFHHLCYLLHVGGDQLLWQLACNLFDRIARWKVSIEVQNHKGLTPLHLAAAYGNLRLARYYVALGCSPARCDRDNHLNAYGWFETAFGVAIDNALLKDVNFKQLSENERSTTQMEIPADAKLRVTAIDTEKTLAMCRATIEGQDCGAQRRHKQAPNVLVGLLNEVLQTVAAAPEQEKSNAQRGILAAGNLHDVQKTFVFYETVCSSSFRKTAVLPKAEEEPNDDNDSSNEPDYDRSTSSSLQRSNGMLRKVSHAIMATRNSKRHMSIASSSDG